MRRAAAMLVAAGVGVAGCGSDPKPPSADRQVRAVVDRFAKASAARDYQTICDELVSPALLKGVESFGLPCEIAFEKGLSTAASPKLAVESVRVTGARARVRVRTTAANQLPSTDTLLLTRERGRWRIAALDSGATTGASGASGPTGPVGPGRRPKSGG